MRASVVRRESERFSRKCIETSPSFSALIGRAAAVQAGRCTANFPLLLYVEALQWVVEVKARLLAAKVGHRSPRI